MTFDDGEYAAYLRNPSINAVYYNPAVTYLPWFNADGSQMAPADVAAAYHHPERPWLGTRDFTTPNTEFAGWDDCSVSSTGAFFSCSYTAATRTFFPAVYYRFNGGDVGDRANYVRTEIISSVPSYSGEGREARSDCASAAIAVCTYAEEIQNFANWYQYYRSRALASMSGIGRAFARLPENARVGYGTINKGSTAVDGVSTRTIVSGVRAFNDLQRGLFYDRLYQQVINNFNTPLRLAANSVGEYFQRTDNRGPWNDRPGEFAGTDDAGACRQSFHILMSDGFWNGPNPSVGNSDGSDGSLISNASGDSFQYTPTGPFRDDRSNTLGDVGMYYWKRDLRTDLDNEVPVSGSDPAFWQHLVTFGIGLGVAGSIDPDTAFSAIPAGTDIAWGNPFSSDAAKIDDLLHFGLNSRGGFFSASNPDEFAEALGDVLTAIVERVETSATSAATSAAVLRADTLLYSASFRSEDWSGNVVALEIDEVDGSVGATIWDAESVLAAGAPRNLITFDGSSGVDLDYGSLSDDQKGALDVAADGTVDGLGEQRIDWLSGVEDPALRSRSESGDLRLVGDIINGTPQFVTNRSAGFQLLRSDFSPGLYPAYVASKASRPELLLVPSNGGMLHGFDAEDGRE
ncbi:MAG: hypothetical protein V2I45_02695, partial [Halieaceae bacterium]|nr:hypothetical protein [Halieaceae bacterium]